MGDSALEEIARLKRRGLVYLSIYACSSIYVYLIQFFVPSGPLLVPLGVFTIYADDIPDVLLLPIIPVLTYYAWKDLNRLDALERQLERFRKTRETGVSSVTGESVQWAGSSPEFYRHRMKRRFLSLLGMEVIMGAWVGTVTSSWGSTTSVANFAVEVVPLLGTTILIGLCLWFIYWRLTGLLGIGMSTGGLHIFTSKSEFLVPWNMVHRIGKVETSMGGFIESDLKEVSWIIAWSNKAFDNDRIMRALHGAATRKGEEIVLRLGRNHERVKEILSYPACPKFSESTYTE